MYSWAPVFLIIAAIAVILGFIIITGEIAADVAIGFFALFLLLFAIALVSRRRRPTA